MPLVGIPLSRWIGSKEKVVRAENTISAGWLTGIGGVAIYYLLTEGAEQMLIFTLAGVVLAATGLIIKYQYK